MPPCVKSRMEPPLNGLKLRTNASSPEPVATTHLCAAVEAAVALGDALRWAADAACAANVVRRTMAPKAPSARRVLRAERAELSMLPSFLPRPAAMGGL